MGKPNTKAKSLGVFAKRSAEVKVLRVTCDSQYDLEMKGGPPSIHSTSKIVPRDTQAILKVRGKPQMTRHVNATEIKSTKEARGKVYTQFLCLRETQGQVSHFPLSYSFTTRLTVELDRSNADAIAV